MSIFVDENTKVIYQGLTGSQGKYYGLLNREYGTKVVAGTNPKKAGTEVEGIPIFASGLVFSTYRVKLPPSAWKLGSQPMVQG